MHENNPSSICLLWGFMASCEALVADSCQTLDVHTDRAVSTAMPLFPWSLVAFKLKAYKSPKPIFHFLSKLVIIRMFFISYVKRHLSFLTFASSFPSLKGYLLFHP